MKNNKHLESFGKFNENLINRLSNWNTDRVRKKERLKIYDQYKRGDISYEEYVKQRKELEESYNKKINESMDDLFQVEYKGEKIKIKGKFLKLGEERDLLKKLKKFNLGSGYEEMKLSKIDDDNFVFRLETYVGGPTQTIYFERLEKI